MTKVTIRRLGVLSIAKMYAALMFCIMLIISIPYGLIIMALGASAFGVKDGGAIGAGGVVAGLAIMIGLPIFYGVIGFVFGAIGALLYNLFAGFVGGVEMELEGIGGVAGYMNPPAPPQQWQTDPYSQYVQK
jgi:hypothetical protein